MPTPLKPRALKNIAGTERPDRDGLPAANLPALSEAPPAPDWMPNAFATKEWERLAPILAANKLLTEASLSALGVLCALHGQIVDMWSRRVEPNGALLGQYRALINDFGLTPVAQGKVKQGAQEKKGNPFARNGKRPS